MQVYFQDPGIAVSMPITDSCVQKHVESNATSVGWWLDGMKPAAWRLAVRKARIKTEKALEVRVPASARIRESVWKVHK